MNREEYVKEIIGLTLTQVREQGWDLLDAQSNDAIEMVYKAIKEDLY